MRLDELPRSDRVEDRRGLPAGRAGIGIGTVVVLALIGWALGIDPSTLIGGAEQTSGGGQTQQQVPTGAPSDQMGQFVSPVLGSTEEVWTEVSLAPERRIHHPLW
jgi:predicted metalloprotease